jgi:hypothetical protein
VACSAHLPGPSTMFGQFGTLHKCGVMRATIYTVKVGVSTAAAVAAGSGSSNSCR